MKDYLSGKKSGDDGTVDTPVPIPNTEVKHRNGDCIRKERVARCRAFFLPFFMYLFVKDIKLSLILKYINYIYAFEVFIIFIYMYDKIMLIWAFKELICVIDINLVL